MTMRVTRWMLNQASRALWRFRLGPGVTVNRGVVLSNVKRCSIGTRVFVDYDCVFGAELEDGWLTINDDVQINHSCVIDYSGGLRIGKRALLSSEVLIYTHTHGHDPRSPAKGRSLEIGDSAWIGSRAILLSSVNRVGKGAIVAAGSIVTKPVPDWAIVAGNPATIVGTNSSPHDLAINQTTIARKT